MDWYPLLILAVGIAVVLTMILALRINAFIALLTAAFTVSLMAAGEPAIKIGRVAEAFGNIVGSIGIVIALAAIIGRALMDSGAAERIVLAFMRLLGEKRTKFAFLGSGFVLSVPVFFDTVFYLLVPLARSLGRRTKKNYLLYLTAIVAGAAVTHTMVPPTPGPLFMANAFKVDLGTMILVGSILAVPMSLVGLVVCGFLNRRLDIPMRPLAGTPDPEPLEESALPPLWISLAPVVLPVLLISFKTVTEALHNNSADVQPPPVLAAASSLASLIGNPNIALFFSAVIAVITVAIWRRKSLTQLSADAEESLMSGGLIILITAAGGAFGAMLREAGIQGAVEGLVGSSSTRGIPVLLAAAGVAALMKFAQGSGTVAMITAASIFAAIGFTAEGLGFNVVYLCCAIGSGSLVGGWMNDSGFWIYAKMSGLTTEETLKTWSVLLAALGITGLVITVVAATLLPLRG